MTVGSLTGYSAACLRQGRVTFYRLPHAVKSFMHECFQVPIVTALHYENWTICQLTLSEIILSVRLGQSWFMFWFINRIMMPAVFVYSWWSCHEVAAIFEMKIASQLIWLLWNDGMVLKEMKNFSAWGVVVFFQAPNGFDAIIYFREPQHKAGTVM